MIKIDFFFPNQIEIPIYIFHGQYTFIEVVIYIYFFVKAFGISFKLVSNSFSNYHELKIKNDLELAT